MPKEIAKKSILNEQEEFFNSTSIEEVLDKAYRKRWVYALPDLSLENCIGLRWQYQGDLKTDVEIGLNSIKIGFEGSLEWANQLLPIGYIFFNNLQNDAPELNLFFSPLIAQKEEGITRASFEIINKNNDRLNLYLPYKYWPPQNLVGEPICYCLRESIVSKKSYTKCCSEDHPDSYSFHWREIINQKPKIDEDSRMNMSIGLALYAKLASK